MRSRLPNRRESTTLNIFHNNERYHVSYSQFPDGAIGEVFLHGPKVGSDMDAVTFTTGVILSIALQHGATLEELSHSTARFPDGSAADFIGHIIDVLIKES